MIRVSAPSRLHFGLLSLAPAGSATRRFGSVGLMVEAPGVVVRVEPAATWSATGPLAERALTFARRFERTLSPDTLPPQHLVVERAAPEHVGLGSGTQLALGVARALARAARLEPLNATDMAWRVGRGQRSALGVHGFERGGFLVEAGKRRGQNLGPLVARADFPSAWPIVVILPPWGKGLHGVHEVRAFEQLAARCEEDDATDHLCRLVLLEMLPALAEGDGQALGEAVFEFNRRVGEIFRPVQRGTYAHARTAEVVEFVRRQGIAGVGQSSWGPGVFAILTDEDAAGDLAGRLRQHFGLATEEAIVTRACNRGATLAEESIATKGSD